ncbi:hypothetical protein Drose_11225 [Dactylosporangium roseum]|uniref:Transmembrane protein n=1 Tax=Dactylosporangium roseum TaxID=47989 RepID=A0ABY5Z9K0_9ACTN|nr:DUF6766 family protein [Dactylosporangium roseum]UWZ38739.1 hypothetical protein Drose_11225 [Dactylosporangium roseum]
MRRWLRFNALSVVMFSAFVLFIVLQSVFGWHTQNAELADHGRAVQSYLRYLGSGDFVESVFENWESEFLQMASYVWLTAFVLQRGSPESQPLGGADDDPERQRRPGSPWPVRRGGLALKLYSNSLTILLAGLFLVSFVLHLLGGTAAYNESQALHGGQPVHFWQFLANSEFWFQSMQNWQSEFMSVGVLVVAGIFLRQRGSSQSKKVAEPHAKTGG